MSKNNPVTRFNVLNVVYQADERERLLIRTAQPSYRTAMEPSANDATTTDACNAAFEKLETQRQAADFVNHPNTIDPSHSMNVDKAALCELVNTEAERQVDDHLQGSSMTPVGELFMDDTQLAMNSVFWQQRSALNGLLYV